MLKTTSAGVSPPESKTITLEELAFLSAGLFFIGSGISLYIAYKNLERANSTVDSVIQTVL